MAGLTKIVNTIILTGAIGINGLTEQLTPAYAQELAKAETGQTQKYEKHDHSETFYTSNFSKDSISLLESELSVHPTAAGYVRLSDLFFENEQLEKAGQAARESIRLDNNFGDGYVNLGTYYSKSGNHQAAYNILHEGLNHLPSDLNIIFNLGISSYRVGKFQESYDHLSRVIAMKPTHPREIRNKDKAIKSREIVNQKLTNQ